MTAQAQVAAAALLRRWRTYLRHFILVALINVPCLSFGLALGWVSLATGEVMSGAGAGGAGAGVVAGAAATFGAGLLGMPLAARALAVGRKFTIIVSSATFAACWSIKLWRGHWHEQLAVAAAAAWLVAARALAGLAGAAAWCAAPLATTEMVPAGCRGAAAAAPELAHNLGLLLAYLAAYLPVEERTFLWSCLGLSLAHCAVYLLVPESAAFLAAQGKLEEARASLSCIRALPADHPALKGELAALPPPDPHVPLMQLLNNLVGHRGRRRAFLIALVVVVGQELCGLLSVMQFAERLFVMARDDALPLPPPLPNASSTEPVVLSQQAALSSPAGHALILGVVQFVASALSLYMVERVGRRPLLVWSSVGLALLLGAAAGLAWAGAGGRAAAAALGTAVAVDALGVQAAPYAMLPEMFHYEYRSSAVLLITGAVWAAGGLELVVFPALGGAWGLAGALGTAALLAALYAALVAALAPETRGRSPDEIYDDLCGTESRDAVARL